MDQVLAISLMILSGILGLMVGASLAAWFILGTVEEIDEETWWLVRRCQEKQGLRGNDG